MNTVSEIIKQFGDKAVLPASAVVEDKKQIIPWAPSLDIILGGGVPEGSWVFAFDPDEVFEGPSSVHMSVPISSYPLFIREGSEVSETVLDSLSGA